MILSNYSIAQLPDFPFIDSTSEWTFEGFSTYQEFDHCNLGFAYGHSIITFFIDGDTTIAGNTYHKMFEERIDSNYCANDASINWVGTSTSFKRYIREDNHKLYVYSTSNQTDVLFRDYEDITVGTVLSNSCTVGSIDTLHLLHQPYLKYNCECNYDFLIQGIGTKRNLLATTDCGTGIEGDWHNLCYKKNGFTIAIDSLSTCISTGDSTLYVATNDLIPGKDYTFYPNPTTDLITIELNENLSGNYTIFSLTGKKIITQQFSNSTELIVDFSNFSKGVYFLVLYADKGTVTSMKILKL